MGKYGLSMVYLRFMYGLSDNAIRTLKKQVVQIKNKKPPPGLNIKIAKN